MALIVQKYGGTSVASPRHIEQRESVQFIELAAHLRRVLETC